MIWRQNPFTLGKIKSKMKCSVTLYKHYSFPASYKLAFVQPLFETQDLPDDERERGFSPGISVELVDTDAAELAAARTVISSIIYFWFRLILYFPSSIFYIALPITTSPYCDQTTGVSDSSFPYNE